MFLFQASFFIAYVVTSGWTVIFCIELFRLKFLIFRILKGALCCCSNEDEFISNPYHKQIPRILFFSLLGIIYFFLSPLILPFVMIFYGLGYIIYRNQVSPFPHLYTLTWKRLSRLSLDISHTGSWFVSLFFMGSYWMCIYQNMKLAESFGQLFTMQQ